MSLNSVTFILLFLPIFVVVYAWLSRSARLGLMGLLTGSVVFYSLAGGWYILVLLTQATLTYVLARVLLIANNVPRRRLGLLLGLLNLAPLIAIKYLPLLFEN